jgi:hypothetical protein
VENENGDCVEVKHGQSAKDWWPTGHLLPPFPPTISLFSSTTTYLG